MNDEREFLMIPGWPPEGAEGDVLLTDEGDELIITEVELMATYYVRQPLPGEIHAGSTFVDGSEPSLIFRKKDHRSRGLGISLRTTKLDRERKQRAKKNKEERE